MVTTAFDENDPTGTDGLGLSLREAVLLANANGESDTITFASTFPNRQAFAVSMGELPITEPVTIDGGSIAPVIQGNRSSRIFNVTAPAGAQVSLNGVTIRGGHATSDGGGIRVDAANLNLTNTWVTDNATSGDSARGGGIFINSGALTLTRSTISGNSTTGANAHGGGIFSNSASVNFQYSTVSGNETTGQGAHGGGLYTNSGNVSVNRLTVTANKTTGASSNSGGIFANTGQVSGQLSVIAGSCPTTRWPTSPHRCGHRSDPTPLPPFETQS